MSLYASDYCNCMLFALCMKVTLPPRGAGWRIVRVVYTLYMYGMMLRIGYTLTLHVDESCLSPSTAKKRD